MATVVIPTDDEPGTQTTTLDGVQYQLVLAYNQRCDAWYLDLYTLDGTLVAAGIKLVCNWNLLLKCASPLRPPGKLVVFSNTTDASTPGLEDLVPGGRCVLEYIELADLEAAAAAAASST